MGQPVDRIYGFCTERIAVGYTHRYQDAIRKAVGKPVTIHDGNWIAEQLAEPDLFWVAERYLDIPAAMRPAPAEPGADLPEWYVAIRSYWRSRAEPARTHGDFYELRRALREAVDPGPARADVPFWLSRMRVLLDDPDQALVQRVRYEVAAGHVLGLRDLRPADDLVRRYFAGIAEETEVFRLDDAVNLVMFTLGLAAAGRSTIRPLELREWRGLLAKRYSDLLAGAQTCTRRAYLWLGAGVVALLPDPPDDVVFPDEAQPIPDLDELREMTAPRLPHAAQEVQRDHIRAVDSWLNALDALEDGNVFSHHRLGELLEVSAPMLADTPRWRELTGRFDELSALVDGRAAAARNAYTRAISLHDAGRVRQAISELHSARVDWYSGETLVESVTASLALAECYGELGLMHASKQFALSAAFIAYNYDRDDLRPIIPHGLDLASGTDFNSGRWLTALPILMSFIESIGENGPSVFEPSVQPGAAAPLRRFSLLLAATRDLDPAIDAAVRDLMDHEPWLEIRDHILSAIPPKTREAWLEEVPCSPFSDAGERFQLTSQMFGIRWTVEADATDRLVVLAAGRFMAWLEVLLVELAETDLCLMPTDTTFHVRVAGRETGEDWDVELMPNPDGGELMDALAEVLGAIFAALSMRSLMREEQLHDLSREVLERGLLVRLFAGRTYDELADHGAGGRWIRPPGRSFAPRAVEEPPAHDELQWQGGPGPTYSREIAEDALERRYSTFVELLPFTLGRLTADPGFQQLVAELRSAGWLDWHILQSIHGVVVTARTPDDDTLTMEERVRIAYTPEGEDDPPVPIALFTRESLEGARLAGIVAGLGIWDLELRDPSPDRAALERFMAERYAYWTDDVSHTDPF
jgi:hypothetical protein